MPNQYVPDRMVIKSIIERKRYAAGVAEDTVNAFASEAFKQHPGATNQIGHVRSSSLFLSDVAGKPVKTEKATGPGVPRRWPSGFSLVAHSGGARYDDPDDNAYEYEHTDPDAEVPDETDSGRASPVRPFRGCAVEIECHVLRVA
jgi:hypothetical protein